MTDPLLVEINKNFVIKSVGNYFKRIGDGTIDHPIDILIARTKSSRISLDQVQHVSIEDVKMDNSDIPEDIMRIARAINDDCTNCGRICCCCPWCASSAPRDAF